MSIELVEDVVSPDDSNVGPWVLIGLDGEMSSADIETGGKLIQAGAAAWVGNEGGDIDRYVSLIGQTDMEWSERAAEVHGLPRELVEAGPDSNSVDDEFYEWLIAHGGIEGRRILVPIGLNVAAFDMPYFRQALPRSSSLFARRAVDLNAMCFSFAGWDPNPKAGNARDFASWKRSMKANANAELLRRGFPTVEHDAGFDAAQALVSLWWLRRQMFDATAMAADALRAADEADPLRAALGAGLLKRLDLVPREVLGVIVANLDSKVSPSVWFGRFNQVLNATPLNACIAGRVAEVVAASKL